MGRDPYLEDSAPGHLGALEFSTPPWVALRVRVLTFLVAWGEAASAVEGPAEADALCFRPRSVVGESLSQGGAGPGKKPAFGEKAGSLRRFQALRSARTGRLEGDLRDLDPLVRSCLDEELGDLLGGKVELTHELPE